MPAVVGVRRSAPAIAVVLGALAFLADAVDGAAGQFMVALVSSGLSWGLAALLTGRAATDRRTAVTSATTLLVLATLVYYLLILVVSRRWSGGFLQDGSSADLHGLRSLAIMTTAWLAVSAVAGPVFGLLGHMTRTMRAPGAALAAGAACGLLSSQSWQTSSWYALTAIGGPGTGFAAARLAEFLAPLAVLAWLATVHHLWRAWPVLLTTTILTASAGALFWHLLHATANRLG